MKTLFKLMVMLVVGLAADVATAKEHAESCRRAAPSDLVPGDYKLRVEIRRQDSARQVFDLTINNQPYRTKADGMLEINGLAQGVYAVKPMSTGFTYEPVAQTVYLKYRKEERVRFYATASDLVTPSVAIIVEPAALKVSEGGTVNLAVKLSGPPEEDIALAVSYAGDPDIKVSPTSLMFSVLGLECGQKLDGDGRQRRRQRGRDRRTSA